MTTIPRNRPRDQPIENWFMNKLRGRKMLAITTESALELSLKSLEQNLEESQSLPIESIFALASSLPTERKQALNEVVNLARDKWVFREINQTHLPQYLFDDKTDLSYIFEFFKTSSQISKLSCGDLVFIALLGLRSQELIDNKILEFFTEKYDRIVHLLEQSRRIMEDETKSNEDFIFSQSREPSLPRNRRITRNRSTDSRNRQETENLVKKTVNYIASRWFYVL